MRIDPAPILALILVGIIIRGRGTASWHNNRRVGKDDCLGRYLLVQNARDGEGVVPHKFGLQASRD